MCKADILVGTSTSAATLMAARDFVRSVACVTLSVQKEIIGFCFDSIWRTVKRQGLYMWAGGFADFRDIDRAWTVFTGMTYRPFSRMDLVGLDVIHVIENACFCDSGNPHDEPPAALAEKLSRGSWV